MTSFAPLGLPRFLVLPHGLRPFGRLRASGGLHSSPGCAAHAVQLSTFAILRFQFSRTPRAVKAYASPVGSAFFMCVASWRSSAMNDVVARERVRSRR